MAEDIPVSKITPELLLENGWVKTDDPIVIFEKKIENRNPINSDPEDTDLKLIVHGYFGGWMFALFFPNGAMLNIMVKDIDELNAFENMIGFYDCEY